MNYTVVWRTSAQIGTPVAEFIDAPVPAVGDMLMTYEPTPSGKRMRSRAWQASQLHYQATKCPGDYDKLIVVVWVREVKEGNYVDDGTPVVRPTPLSAG